MRDKKKKNCRLEFKIFFLISGEEKVCESHVRIFSFAHAHNYLHSYLMKLNEINWSMCECMCARFSNFSHFVFLFFFFDRHPRSFHSTKNDSLKKSKRNFFCQLQANFYEKHGQTFTKWNSRQISNIYRQTGSNLKKILYDRGDSCYFSRHSIGHLDRCACSIPMLNDFYMNCC